MKTVFEVLFFIIMILLLVATVMIFIALGLPWLEGISDWSRDHAREWLRGLRYE